ncbi:MAG TPA: DUF1428 domain-containing protein [Phenylobacterium sp.]
MIYGGFEVLSDEKTGAKAGYVDGMVLAVPANARDAYRELTAKTNAVIKEHGATRVVEAWGDDVPEGKVTDFQGAVKAGGDEVVVFSWIEWASKAARDEGWAKIMADPRMNEAMSHAPYDGKRQIYGGFSPLVDM